MQTPEERQNSQRVAMAEQFAERRTVIHGLLGGRCVVCGTRDDLQIDHIDPSTKVTDVSNLWSYTWDRLLEESRKCQLLCEKHHREKTLRDMGWANSRLEHGTPRSWKHCKCETCRKAHREYQRDYRQRRRQNRGLTLGWRPPTIRQSGV